MAAIDTVFPTKFPDKKPQIGDPCVVDPVGFCSPCCPSTHKTYSSGVKSVAYLTIAFTLTSFAGICLLLYVWFAEPFYTEEGKRALDEGRLKGSLGLDDAELDNPNNETWFHEYGMGDKAELYAGRLCLAGIGVPICVGIRIVYAILLYMAVETTKINIKEKITSSWLVVNIIAIVYMAVIAGLFAFEEFGAPGGGFSGTLCALAIIFIFFVDLLGSLYFIAIIAVAARKQPCNLCRLFTSRYTNPHRKF